MSEIRGTTLDDDYHHGNKPWSEKKRAVPLRTFSGNIVYKRKKHAWTTKDLVRISKNIEIVAEENPEINWVKEVLLRIKDITLLLLEKILWFLDEQDITSLYDWVYQLLGKIFGIDTTYMMSHRSKGEELIYLLAAKFELEVTIKRL